MASKRVLIVGASRGIGLGLAERYSAEGWEAHVTIRSDRVPATLEPSDTLQVHRFDVRDDPTGLIEAVGNLDLLIHNAGVGRGTPRAEMMAVNAEAPIRLAQAFIDAGSLSGGKLALITSQLGARRGRTESLGDYGDSKAALNDEFRARAADWAAAGVIAVVIHPGWVRTDMGGSSAPLSVAESVDGMFDLFERLSEDHHGRFWTWDGRQHDW